MIITFRLYGIFFKAGFLNLMFMVKAIKQIVFENVNQICNVKVAFIPYITAGDPDLSTTAQALKVLDLSGSDIIELGVPYSDPLADGPVIQV